MDFRYRFLTLGKPWTYSMPSRDVNAVTGLADRLREGRNILQDIRSGEEQYFTGPNQNLPDRKI